MGLRKRSFTYSGDPITRKDAIRKAKKEGMNFSELVDGLLKAYTETPDKPKKKTVFVFGNEEYELK